jgi:hypothetical protein
MRRIGTRVAAALEQVRQKAPDAQVVLVGYLRLVDAEQGCSAFPLAPGDRAFLARVEQLLNRALARAAREVGADFVDMHPASAGHEICSTDPWVNGKVTDQQAALAYHPFAAGEQAVAEAVLGLLEGRG